MAIYYLISLLVILLDQGTKWLVVRYMELGEQISLIEGWLYITSHRNRGAAFGILQGQFLFFYLISTAVIILLIIFIQKYARKDRFLGFILALGLGGAVGNFIDRLFRGAVVDFIDVRIFSYHYPIFNIADSALVIAVLLYVIKSFMEEKRKKHGNG